MKSARTVGHASDLLVVAGQAALAQEAAKRVVAIAEEAVARCGRFTVALAGGSTPKRLYSLLAAEPYCARLPWRETHVFWGDERAVPPEHPDSNFGMARATLLSRVPIPADQIHRMQAERQDLDAAAGEYEAEIARTFAAQPPGEPPAFDLILLGLGPDGHTASLFPYTPALRETRRWVVPNYIPKLKVNYPAASRGVSGTGQIPSEKSELLRVELGVLLLPALLDNVALDLPFAPVATDRADVVPVRPELAAPEVLLDRGHPAEDLPGGATLDDPDQLRWAVRRERLHQEVYVVPVRADLQERDLVPGRDLEADVSEPRVHVRRDHRTPVLRRTDDVVEQDGDVVAAVDVFTHPPSLSQPDAASRGVSTLNGMKQQRGEW